MSAPALYPIPMATLAGRLQQELEAGGDVYLLPRREWWVPDRRVDPSLVHFGHRIATPAGPASGPHTQLAQNLVLAWLAGGRFIELKTIQINDELDIPRPCIFVPHVGYNVEWSQELRLHQSAEEYVKGWMLVHMAAELAGLWDGTQCVFDLSLGYDLAGIRTERVRDTIDALRSASPLIDHHRRALRSAGLHRLADVDVPSTVCDTVTLSTFHGCPADEIESIARQTLDWGLHTVVKLNPTLLGHDRCRSMLDTMGYRHIRLDRHAFEKDLQWDQLMAMVPRLRAHAASVGRGIGFKFTNTLVCHSDETPFKTAEQGGSPEMYLSGPPLHVLSFTLAAEFMEAVPEAPTEVPITFSAGVDASNFVACVGAGLGPVTSCSDLLKSRGYGRLSRYVRNLETALVDVGDIAGLRARAGGASARAKALPTETVFHFEQNATPPKKVGTHLVLLDCLTCDKCIPVCPNAAIFRLELPRGTWRPGRMTWRDAAFEVFDGDTLTIERRHQIGIHADACNQCGQCDPWCPEHGGPYVEKPNLFLTRQAFEDHPGRLGFLLSPDGAAIAWRRGPDDQVVLTRQPDGAERLELPGGSILFVDDKPVSTSGTGAVDLSVAVMLRLFRSALPDAATWLPSPTPPGATR